MLDDKNVLLHKDPHRALDIVAHEWEQVSFVPEVLAGEHDNRHIRSIVVAGMGGSALAAGMIKTWLGDRLKLPFEVVRAYDLPHYVDRHTLVLVSSYSGVTEEALNCLSQARDREAQVAILAAGGELLDIAARESIAHVVVPGGIPQRMAMFYMLKGFLGLLQNFHIIEASVLDEVTATAEWLRSQTAEWLPEVSTDKNPAKQIALLAVGKTPLFYGGSLTGPVAYKWKISWNENAKNVAFSNEYPEFNHNEFMGWTSHPIEKPFAVFDLISNHEHPQVLRRFVLSDRLLSGKRPKSYPILLRGETLIAQLLWACVLADFTSVYVAILNGVDPVPVALIEKLKKELA